MTENVERHHVVLDAFAHAFSDSAEAVGLEKCSLKKTLGPVMSEVAAGISTYLAEILAQGVGDLVTENECVARMMLALEFPKLVFPIVTMYETAMAALMLANEGRIFLPDPEQWQAYLDAAQQELEAL